MTTVPGTYFTKEQLEAALRGNAYFYFLQSHSKQTNKLVCVADKVSVGDRTGSDRLSQTGYVYYNDKNQYDKALAWYILAARENNSYAQNNIGVLYNYGLGVPKNDMCALKWYLKAAERSVHVDQSNHIGELFETDHGVPLDKYKALEWYSHGKYEININRLEGQGYHRSATDNSKFNSIIDYIVLTSSNRENTPAIDQRNRSHT
jgi:TPR repeat protein